MPEDQKRADTGATTDTQASDAPVDEAPQTGVTPATEKKPGDAAGDPSPGDLAGYSLPVDLPDAPSGTSLSTEHFSPAAEAAVLAALAAVSHEHSLGWARPGMEPEKVLFELGPQLRFRRVKAGDVEGISGLFRLATSTGELRPSRVDKEEGLVCVLEIGSDGHADGRVEMNVGLDVFSSPRDRIPERFAAGLRDRALYERARAAERLALANELDALAGAMEAEPPPAWAWPRV